MNAVRRGSGACAVVLALGLWGALPVEAQRAPGAGRPQDRAQLERRVRARFAEMMQRRLALTDEQSRALSAVVDGLQAERMELGRDEQVLRRRLEALLVDDEASDEEARALLQRMTDLRAREARLFQDEQQKLLEVLTPTQVVRFHAMREQLAARIQQLRGGPPGRRPGGSPDPDHRIFPPGS